MFKRVLSMIIVAALSVVLFTGCSSSKPENFDADQFVKECRLLVPSSQYQSAVTRDFKLDFSKTVMDKFGKSDYYNNMNEEQRFEESSSLGKCSVLLVMVLLLTVLCGISCSTRPTIQFHGP